MEPTDYTPRERLQAALTAVAAAAVVAMPAAAASTVYLGVMKLPWGWQGPRSMKLPRRGSTLWLIGSEAAAGG